MISRKKNGFQEEKKLREDTGRKYGSEDSRGRYQAT